MTLSKKKKKLLFWRITQIAGFVAEIAFILLALYSMVRGQHTIPAWQQIAFVAILVWIYIAYLKQKALDISAFMVDEKIKTHSLVEHLEEGVLLLTPENKILLLNSRAAALTGLSELDALGKDLAALVSPELGATLQSQSSGELMGRMEGESRNLLFAIKLLSPQKAADSHKLVRVHEHVSSAKASDSETRTETDMLNRALCALASSIGEIPADRRPEAVNRAAAQAAATLLTLRIRTALQDAAVEDAGKTIERTPISVDALQTDALKEIQPYGKGLKVSLEPAHLSPTDIVGSDSSNLLSLALRQALYHSLLSCPSGSAIHLQTGHMGVNMGIAIRDNGPTPSMESVSQVFETTCQGLKDAGGQFVRQPGFGLAEARKIVESHGGTMWADVPPEGGFRITMMLPTE